MVLQTSQSVLTAVLSNLEREPFMNVEVVLRVFYMLGEVITNKVSSQQSCRHYCASTDATCNDHLVIVVCFMQKCGSSNVSVPGSPWHHMMIAVRNNY